MIKIRTYLPLYFWYKMLSSSRDAFNSQSLYCTLSCNQIGTVFFDGDFVLGSLCIAYRDEDIIIDKTYNEQIICDLCFNKF